MIIAMLKSEWIKFRSYYIALGAALVALVVVPFFLMNLDYSQTVVGQTQALSEALHALYLAQPVIVIFTSLYFAQEFVKSGMRTNFLTVSNRKAWLTGKFLFLVLLLLVLYSIMVGSCFLVMLARFDLSFSCSLLGKFLYYSSFGLLSNLFLALLAAGLALLFQSWVVPVSVLFPLLIGLSRLLATFIKEAKYLPDLATLNLFEYEGLQNSIQYRILVVDDDRSILKLVKNVLELDAYDVTTLDRIEELELTHFVGYDLILLDVMMEPVNGFELCSYIRPHLSCPIIFLTAKELEADKVEGLFRGADDYIVKPFGTKELLARVRAHLRREERREERYSEIASCQFYPERYEVACFGKVLKFSEREFKLLHLLASNPKQTFSAERLHTLLYPESSETQLRSISEYVYQIRQKCKQEGLQAIATVRGVGYRWQLELEIFKA